MDRLIEGVRKGFGPTPRSFGLSTRWYNRLRKPLWYRWSGDKRFECLFEDQQALFEKGTVVWGQIVQANTLLFESGASDSPADAIFSLDPYYDRHLSDLAEMADYLFGFKGAKDPPEEVREFAEVITDEMLAPFNVLLPHKMTSGRDVYFTSLMISRKHLPEKRLVAGWLPLVVGPTFTKASAVVPKKYWPGEVVDRWCNAE
jgi:hypothetical protein